MSTVIKQYSGIVIDQNNPLATTASSAQSASFTLPNDYVRGSADPVTGVINQIIPDLTGFHVFTNVGNAATCSITWNLVVNSQTIASGTNVGAARTGYSWFSVLFNDSIPIPSTWLGFTFTLNITAVSNLTLGLSSGPELMYRILASTADSGTDFLGNVYRSAILESVVENSNTFQSEDIFSSWMSNPCPSQFGVEAMYMDVRQGGLPAVIDRLTLTPMTPGVYFHVYYSNDSTGPGTDTASWANLLWTPVYATYQLNRSQTFALPEPIVCKYVCIEFTNLQARSYNPGNFQLPTTYNKYPLWVLNYFINLFQNQELDTLSSQVNVVYDALDLGYTYYQGDIIQEPDAPVQANAPISQQSSFIDQSANQVDSTTLQKISLNFQPWLVQPALSGGDASMISQYASATAPLSYSSEVISTAIGNTTFVSNTNREALLVEKAFPKMFFYLPCRHAFRVVQANFGTNVAYFAGVKEVILHRDVYTGYSDQTQYNENLGDGTNLLWNDFLPDPGGVIPPPPPPASCPNVLTNPSFESPLTPIPASGWQPYQNDWRNPSNESFETFTQSTAWASQGTHSLHLQGAVPTSTPPYELVIDYVGANLDTPCGAPFARPVAAGSFLSVCISDAYGFVSWRGGTVTDTQGNTYHIDSTGFESDLVVCSCLVTNALSVGDSLLISNGNNFWPLFRVAAFAFTNVVGHDASSVSHDDGQFQPLADVTMAPNCTPTSGDLLIGWANFSNLAHITSDGTSEGFTNVLTGYGDTANQLAMAWQQVNSNAEVTWTTHYTGPGAHGGICQSTLQAYTTSGVVTGPPGNSFTPYTSPFAIDCDSHQNSPVPINQTITAGTFLSLISVNGSGDSAQLTSVTDTKGNTYTVDVEHLSYFPNGSSFPQSGAIHVVSANITSTLIAGTDTITFHWTGSPNYVLPFFGVTFPGMTAVKRNAATGAIFDGVSGKATMGNLITNANSGDLVLGYAVVYQPMMLNDGAPWTPIITDYGDYEDRIVAAWQQASATGEVTYRPTTADGTYQWGAGAILSYQVTSGTITAPPTFPSFSAPDQSEFDAAALVPSTWTSGGTPPDGMFPVVRGAPYKFSVDTKGLRNSPQASLAIDWYGIGAPSQQGGSFYPYNPWQNHTGYFQNNGQTLAAGQAIVVIVWDPLGTNSTTITEVSDSYGNKYEQIFYDNSQGTVYVFVGETAEPWTQSSPYIDVGFWVYYSGVETGFWAVSATTLASVDYADITVGSLVHGSNSLSPTITANADDIVVGWTGWHAPANNGGVLNSPPFQESIFATSHNFPVTQAVAAGSFLSVYGASSFADYATIEITDTKGNAYVIDALETAPDGEILVAHSHITNALTTSDSIIATINGGIDTSHIPVLFATVFEGPVGAVHVKSVSPYGTPELSVSNGDLVIGWATSFGLGPTTGGWQGMYEAGSGYIGTVGVWQQVTANETLTWSPPYPTAGPFWPNPILIAYSTTGTVTGPSTINNVEPPSAPDTPWITIADGETYGGRGGQGINPLWNALSIPNGATIQHAYGWQQVGSSGAVTFNATAQGYSGMGIVLKAPGGPPALISTSVASQPSSLSQYSGAPFDYGGAFADNTVADGVYLTDYALAEYAVPYINLNQEAVDVLVDNAAFKSAVHPYLSVQNGQDTYGFSIFTGTFFCVVGDSVSAQMAAYADSAVTWLATGLPPGLSINASTGEISGTITAEYGQYTATITAMDSDLCTGENIISFNVVSITTVTAPAAQSTITSAHGVAITPVTITATNSVGNALTYSGVNLPPGLTVDPTSGIISGTPTTAGTYPTCFADAADSVATWSPAGSNGFTWIIT